MIHEVGCATRKGQRCDCAFSKGEKKDNFFLWLDNGIKNAAKDGLSWIDITEILESRHAYAKEQVK